MAINEDDFLVQYAKSKNYGYGNNLDSGDKQRLYEMYAKDQGYDYKDALGANDRTALLDMYNKNSTTSGTSPTPQTMPQVAGNTVQNPGNMINGATSLSDNLPKPIDPNTKGTNVTAPKMDADALDIQAQTAQAATAAQVDPRQAVTYQADTIGNKVGQADVTAAKGTVDPRAVIDASKMTIDTQGVAAGTNFLGKALNDFATQDLNTVDRKATVAGQMEDLQSQFKNAQGEPIIPAFAQGLARNVSKIAAFSGMTGTAAVAAMSNAIMEASLPIAQQDAQFFQTLTIKNLDNKQQSIINKANVLANLEMANMDARMTAAVENSKNFMAMDLANLSNEQQARVINSQNRFQAMLEDSKQVNAQRLFTAQSTNEMNMFYDNLNSQISMYNTGQVNNMRQFNTSEINAAKKFNAELEDSREKFYKEMQFNVDVANAKWRQTITLTQNAQAFEAASTDVKNAVGLTVEQLNQLWDRSDSLLQYQWESIEKQRDRDAAIAMTKLQGKINSKQQDAAGKGQIAGAITGAVASEFSDWLFK